MNRGAINIYWESRAREKESIANDYLLETLLQYRAVA